MAEGTNSCMAVLMGHPDSSGMESGVFCGNAERVREVALDASAPSGCKIPLPPGSVVGPNPVPRVVGALPLEGPRRTSRRVELRQRLREGNRRSPG